MAGENINIYIVMLTKLWIGASYRRDERVVTLIVQNIQDRLLTYKIPSLQAAVSITNGIQSSQGDQ